MAAAHEKDKHVIDAVMGLSIDSSTAESKNTAAEESLRDAAAHLRGKIDKALAFIMAEVGGEGRPSEGDDGAKQGDGDGDSGEVSPSFSQTENNIHLVLYVSNFSDRVRRSRTQL